MTTTKVKPKGTLASIESVFVTFEPYVEPRLRLIIKKDPAAFLQLHQRTELLTKDFYNKLRDYCIEGKVSALLVKARGASLPQLLKLVDFIKEKMGDSQLLRVFRKQLQTRPLIPEPPYKRPKSRWDSAVQRQREISVVLMHRQELISDEDVKLAEVATEAMKKATEEAARADSLQNDKNNMTEQLENYRNLHSEMDKTKEENRRLRQVAEDVSKIEKTSENYQAQVEKLKVEVEKHREEAKQNKANAEKERNRAGDFETELIEVKYELLQTKDDFADQTKELVEKNKEIEATQRKLDVTTKKLETALQQIKRLEGEVTDIRHQLTAQDARANRAEARADEAEAKLKETDDRTKKTEADVEELKQNKKRYDVAGNRFEAGARSAFELYFTRSLTTQPGREVGVMSLPPLPSIKEKQQK